MNYYEILEVSPNASQEVLKAAYKSLMQRYHPDRNPGDAEAAKHSVMVVQAYEVLSDTSKRAVYDIERKLQMERLNNIQGISRGISAANSSSNARPESHWILWLLISLTALLLWFIWPHSGKKQPVGSATKEVVSLLGSYQPAPLQNKSSERPTSLAARTIPVYISNLNVYLEAPTESTDASPVYSRHVLTIQAVGVVVGAFDPEKFISFLETNKEYIGRKLSEKLVTAKYEMLVKHDGDHYLKQTILDAIGEITNTNRFEKFPSSGTEPSSQYGAIDILLPYSYSVRPQ